MRKYEINHRINEFHPFEMEKCMNEFHCNPNVINEFKINSNGTPWNRMAEKRGGIMKIDLSVKCNQVMA